MLILGTAALLAPVVVARATALRDPLIGLVASAVLLALGRARLVSSAVGAGLMMALVGYVIWCVRASRSAGPSAPSGVGARADTLELADPNLHGGRGGWVRPVLLALVGLALLVLGGRLLVAGAVELAAAAGLSPELIGLTVVAIGTSLPELVTSVVTAWRQQAAIAFGNVAGSNIYNVLGIGGVTAMLAPGALGPELLNRDLPPPSWPPPCCSAGRSPLVASGGRCARRS